MVVSLPEPMLPEPTSLPFCAGDLFHGCEGGWTRG
jgi:hypothetical protein